MSDPGAAIEQVLEAKAPGAACCDIEGLVHSGNRVLKPPPLPHGKYDKRRGSWLGAPPAFVIKRPAAAALAARIASATAEAPLEIDVVLYHDATRTGSTHRVAAEPQLCYEDEGHSAFDTNIGGGVDTHISEHPGDRKKLR